MKLNDKINVIRDELYKEIPLMNTPHILRTTTIAPSFPTPNKKTIWAMSWQLALLSFLTIALIIPIAIATRRSPQDDSELADLEPLYNSADEVYGFIATSVVAMIYSTSDVFESEDLLEQQSEELLVFEEISFLNRFLSPIEIMLSYNYNHFFRQTSDNRFFSNKIIYDGVGLLGEDIFYEIYFNERLVDSNRFAIDCYVKSNTQIFRLSGNKTIINQATVLEMTYFLDQEDTKDFIRVSKNLNTNADEYEYMVVKDNQTIQVSKLSIVKGEEMYATLENMLATEQTTTFKIYASEENKFEIDYTIASSSDSEINDESPTNETPPEIIESGSIAIDVEANASSFFITSSNYNDVIIINNPNN